MSRKEMGQRACQETVFHINPNILRELNTNPQTLRGKTMPFETTTYSKSCLVI